jgi:hypothetical protein
MSAFEQAIEREQARIEGLRNAEKIGIVKGIALACYSAYRDRGDPDTVKIVMRSLGVTLADLLAAGVDGQSIVGIRRCLQS